MTGHNLPLPLGEREIAEELDGALDGGDKTTRVIRNQMFSFDEFGTRPTLTDPPTIEIAVEQASADPIVRLEQKIDAVSRAMTALKGRIDSIDEVLARLINRL